MKAYVHRKFSSPDTPRSAISELLSSCLAFIMHSGTAYSCHLVPVSPYTDDILSSSERREAPCSRPILGGVAALSDCRRPISVCRQRVAVTSITSTWWCIGHLTPRRLCRTPLLRGRGLTAIVIALITMAVVDCRKHEPRIAENLGWWTTQT